MTVDNIKEFARKEKIKREISKSGLTEREARSLIGHYRTSFYNEGRRNENDTGSARSGGKVQKIYERETGNGKSQQELINSQGKTFSLKDPEGNTLTEQQNDTAMN